MTDPEYNALARIGEIKSRVDGALHEATQLIHELCAPAEPDRRSETRLLEKGTLKIRAFGDVYTATFEPEIRTVEMNGSGKDPHEALSMLINAMKNRKVLG